MTLECPTLFQVFELCFTAEQLLNSASVTCSSDPNKEIPSVLIQSQVTDHMSTVELDPFYNYELNDIIERPGCDSYGKNTDFRGAFNLTPNAGIYVS